MQEEQGEHEEEQQEDKQDVQAVAAAWKQMGSAARVSDESLTPVPYRVRGSLTLVCLT